MDMDAHRFCAFADSNQQRKQNAEQNKSLSRKERQEIELNVQQKQENNVNRKGMNRKLNTRHEN